MARVLFLEGSNCLGQKSRADGRDRVFASPTQAEPVSGHSTPGITAAAFHQLHEARQINASSGTDHDMNMGGQYRHLDHLHALLDGAASQKFIEKGASWRVDHRSTIEGTPRDVEEELMGSQAVALAGFEA
jgi:hypothetical protein